MITRKQIPVIPGLLWCHYGQHYEVKECFRIYPSRYIGVADNCKACESQKSKIRRESAKAKELPYQLLSPVKFF